MADDTAAPAAAPAVPEAPAAADEDNPLAVETLAQLQALPDVKRPTTTLRSKFRKCVGTMLHRRK